ncbi:conserved hypothetical protein [[Clostridium] ultunense Esp]|nr:conserved hypothetical protein [[Clostridium] ultunense Esp]
MEEHPIQGLMSTAMENIKNMVDVSTIIGDPVETPGGEVILPISKVGFGFVAGGTEFEWNPEGGKNREGGRGGDDSGKGLPFGGGSGGGISITPIGFLVVGSAGVKLVPLESSTHLFDRLLDLAPQVVDKLQEMVKQFGNKKGNQGTDRGDKEELPI